MKLATSMGQLESLRFELRPRQGKKARLCKSHPVCSLILPSYYVDQALGYVNDVGNFVISNISLYSIPA